MVVQTRSERVQKANQQVLEMHLINHPVDCPICDQAGECGLQDQYMQYGLYTTEVEKADKVHKSKAQVIGPYVILDQERCVLCSRCVRFCQEVTGTGELGIFNRGDQAEIDVAPGTELANNYSLNTVDICPVGALTSRDFRFQKRVWMLKSTPSICPGCATGCNVRLDHEADRIYRLKPRRNDEVNGPWMCDQGRLTYKAVHDEKRLTEVLLRQEGELRPVTWQAGWVKLVELLAPGNVDLALTCPQQTLEELFLFKQLAAALVSASGLSGHLADTDQGKGDDILLSSDHAPNRRSLDWLEIPALFAEQLSSHLAGSRGAVLVYGNDPAGFDSELASALASCENLIYLGTHFNSTARAATLCLPLSMWAEKDGIFVNRQGRLQALKRAVARPLDAREDWRLLAELGQEAGGLSDPPQNLTDLRVLVRRALSLPDEVDLDRLSTKGLQPDLDPTAEAGGEQ